MVCLDTPTSRATSSTARPASTCFKALIISASLCLPLDMVLPLSFDEIIFNFVRNQGSRSVAYGTYQVLSITPAFIGEQTPSPNVLMVIVLVAIAFLLQLA